jgi:hypothetical protein
MRNSLITIAAALLVSGCLAKQLKHPAEDHYVQTKAIADNCRDDGGYAESPCSPELQEDLDAMAQQAHCVHAISKGEKCTPAAGDDK